MEELSDLCRQSWRSPEIAKLALERAQLPMRHASGRLAERCKRARLVGQ
jgi:hypothetical protein